MSEAVEVMSPGSAAARLGVSGAALRRMAASYEAVHGALPEGSQGRLWPVAAVERIADARALIAAGRAKSVQGALEALADGAVAVEAPEGVEHRGRDAATPGAMVEALRAAQLQLGELRGEVAEMRSELRELRALPPVPVAEAMSERAGERSADGALVRLARRLERLLGGR